VNNVPRTMKAVAIDAFGGIDKLKVQTVPVPEVGPGEVLIRVAFADVAVWDPEEREGHLAELLGRPPTFPLVLGSDGAGEVVAVGAGVSRPAVGDAVYAGAFLNPKGGFYAEYAAVKAELTGPIPRGLSVEQAAVMSGDAVTALRGLADTLHLKPGETVLIFGAGGGLGHLAVQLAKRMGAKVLAVASGADGVALGKKIGADAAVDGRAGDVAAAAREFAPGGLDAALLTAGGPAADAALAALKPTGRIAYPNGVEPAPKPPGGAKAQAYDGNVDAEIISRLNQLIETGPFHVGVAKTFSLEQAADAHQFLGEHYLEKLALRVR
jgi:NADPH2:quinone reductase